MLFETNANGRNIERHLVVQFAIGLILLTQFADATNYCSYCEHHVACKNNAVSPRRINCQSTKV